MRFRDTGSRQFVLQRVLQRFKRSYNEVCQEKSYQKVLTKEVPTYGGEGRRKRIVNVINTFKKTDDGTESSSHWKVRNPKEQEEDRESPPSKSSYDKVPTRKSLPKSS